MSGISGKFRIFRKGSSKSEDFENLEMTIYYFTVTGFLEIFIKLQNKLQIGFTKLIAFYSL